MEAPVSRSAPRMEGPNRGPAAGSGLSLRGHSDCKMSEGASDDSDDDDSLGSGEAAAAVAMAQGGVPGRDGVSGGGGPCFPGRDPMDPGRGVAPTGLKPGKKTRGRVKIKMEFIDNKLRRYTTFSKRKTGIMKKAYELSTLTGTQVMLLVASETGHVYTFATRKLQPMITSESGKALIQTCLNSPDSPPRPTAAAATAPDPGAEQRMSASGFEETELSYQIGEPDIMEDSKVGAESLKPTLFTITNFPGSSPGPHHFSSPSYSPPSSSSGPPTSMAGGHMVGGGHSCKTVQGGHMQTHGNASSFTLMSGNSHAGGAPPAGHTQTQQMQGHSLSVPIPATLVSSSMPVSVAGHVMYQAPHGIMYASSPSLGGDGTSLSGGLAVHLNAFHGGPASMQLHHGPGPTAEQGGLQQLMFAGPSGPVHIPMQLQQMAVIGPTMSSESLTELHVARVTEHKPAANGN
ncbi:serum response factor-like isoform X1 [Lethenteron reissneri]|uniref:serum response factor-like isoform X1 n=1 Tax=Lethenteron reissneri TaxID=7753 RepID=UPI002AB77255|nr:serum response factor-like isoform X1 [Lethenteron reissneri]